MIALTGPSVMPPDANEVPPPFSQNTTMRSSSSVLYQASSDENSDWDTVCTPKELTLAVNAVHPHPAKCEEYSQESAKIALYLQHKRLPGDESKEEPLRKKFSKEDRRKLCCASTSLGIVSTLFACSGDGLDLYWGAAALCSFGFDIGVYCMPEIAPNPACLAEYLSKKGKKAKCTTTPLFYEIVEILRSNVDKKFSPIVQIKKSILLENHCLAECTSDYVNVVGFICKDDNAITQVAILVGKEVISVPIDTFQLLYVTYRAPSDSYKYYKIIHFVESVEMQALRNKAKKMLSTLL